MKTFEDLVFKDHPANINEENKKMLVEKGLDPDMDIFKPMSQAVLQFDNGKSISVIIGKLFYSNGINTYEAMASDESEPKGYLTIYGVTKYMEEIQSR